jgi:HEXXH motif-containing protein
MAVERLHEHSWDDRVQSPFRAGPRPVTGLYHGAFVVTRAAAAMDRIVRATDDPAFRARTPVPLRQVDEALRTIHVQVELTSSGRQLIDHIERVHADLSRTYPFAREMSAPH